MVCCLSLASTLQASISLDGKLDESEWKNARSFSDFVKTSPDTGEKPEVGTLVKMTSDKEGLYFAFINQQSVESRSRKYSAKDQFTSADFISVTIDFSAQGDTLYEFVVTLGNGSMDGVYSRGSQFDGDWEGAWDFKVSEDDKNWTAEIFIPWTIAPFPIDKTNSQQNQNQLNKDLSKMGIYFGRYFIEKGESYSFPDTSPSKANYMQSLHQVWVNKPSGSALQIFPYASLKQDFNYQEVEYRVGADFLWKPTADQQITVAINPDFGQAESDELVANFSAVETLYSDKRAFFTENQSLFDIKSDTFELLNTRRMGGSSDAEISSQDNQPTDIAAAIKYLNTSNSLDFGVMAVLEDDPKDASGKHFLSSRWLVKGEKGYVGQLINWVDRPTIEREVLTSGIDFGYWQDNLNFSGKLLYSKTEQQRAAEGFGSFVKLKYQANREWRSDFSLLWLDEKLELNDMGYLARNDLKQLNVVSEYLFLPENDDSYFREFNWSVDGSVSTNKKGENLADRMSLGVTAKTQQSASYIAQLNYISSGYDDLISRGFGSVELPGRQDWLLGYSSPFSGQTYYQINYHHLQEGLKDWADSIEFSMNYSFNDTTMLSTSLLQLDSDDWLIGNDAGQLTSYQRKFDQLSFNLLWLLAEGQELSIKSQWYAVEAENGKAYNYYSEPTQANNLIQNFKQSQLSMQLRYRYRFAPLSDIYLVYVRNGGFYQEGEDLFGNRDILNQQFDDPDDHQLLFKIRMMF